MALNAAWHTRHPMPKTATLAQRVRWHVAHVKACGCRPMPRTIVTELMRRGKRTPRREKRPRR